ncbi:MAG: hypothetical protein JEZ00_08580 [Anaerolineaceae bacterium]|nr:hypothetical protein [Anaerolineaceae bacterium]
MKSSFWDVLSVLGLLSTCAVAAVMFMIFTNPTSSLNMFPPPTEIPQVIIPSSTATLLKLPPTWTSTPDFQATSTLAATQTPNPSSTSFVLPTFTTTSTPSRTPTITLEATMTYTPGEDQAQEISQSPVDGSSMNTGNDFDLRWEVKNIGTNDWNTGYYYEYQSGVKGSGPESYNLSESVDDGETITLIVDMVAPYDAGNYSSTWVLKNNDGDAIKTLILVFSVK